MKFGRDLYKAKEKALQFAGPYDYLGSEEGN